MENPNDDYCMLDLCNILRCGTVRIIISCVHDVVIDRSPTYLCVYEILINKVYNSMLLRGV